jgi:hypothetical protein
MIIVTLADLAHPKNITSDPVLLDSITKYVEQNDIMNLIARRQILDYTIEKQHVKQQYQLERRLKSRIAIFPKNGKKTEYVFRRMQGQGDQRGLL